MSIIHTGAMDAMIAGKVSVRVQVTGPAPEPDAATDDGCHVHPRHYASSKIPSLFSYYHDSRYGHKPSTFCQLCTRLDTSYASDVDVCVQGYLPGAHRQSELAVAHEDRYCFGA